MNVLDLNNKIFFGQYEVLLIDANPMMRYAKILIIDEQKMVEVNYSTLKNKKMVEKQISLAWFGRKK